MKHCIRSLNARTYTTRWPLWFKMLDKRWKIRFHFMTFEDFNAQVPFHWIFTTMELVFSIQITKRIIYIFREFYFDSVFFFNRISNSLSKYHRYIFENAFEVLKYLSFECRTFWTYFRDWMTCHISKLIYWIHYIIYWYIKLPLFIHESQKSCRWNFNSLRPMASPARTNRKLFILCFVVLQS